MINRSVSFKRFAFLALALVIVAVAAQGCKKRPPKVTDYQKKKIASEYIKAHYDLGVIAGQYGKYDKAIEEFRICLEKDPEHGPSYHGIGLALSKRGDVHDGMLAIQKSIALDPNNGQAYQNLGVILIKQNKLDEARKYLEKAVSLDGADINARYNLAQLYYKVGDTAKAIYTFRKLVEDKSDIPIFHSWLGWTYFEKGMVDQAIVEYEQAIALDKRRFKDFYQLGVIYQSKQEWDLAIGMYKEVVNISSTHVDSYINMADIYRYELKDFANARKYYDLTLSVDVENKYARRMLQEIDTAEGKR